MSDLADRQRNLVRWTAPFGLVASVAYLVWAMWHEPLSTLHFVAWFLIGVGNGFSLLLQFNQKWIRWSLITNFVFVGAAAVVAGREPNWLRITEGMSIIVICWCCFLLGWLLLDKFLPVSGTEAEQLAEARNDHGRAGGL